MLVYTGAKVSVLVLNLIPDNISIKTDKQLEIVGIKTGSIKPSGNTETTLHEGVYNVQVAPEEIQFNEDGQIGRDILKDSIIHNNQDYVDNCGRNYPFCVQKVKTITFKLRTETIVVLP